MRGCSAFKTAARGRDCHAPNVASNSKLLISLMSALEAGVLEGAVDEMFAEHFEESGLPLDQYQVFEVMKSHLNQHWKKENSHE